MEVKTAEKRTNGAVFMKNGRERNSFNGLRFVRKASGTTRKKSKISAWLNAR